MGGDMGLDGDMPLEVEEPEDWSDEERDEQGDPGPSGRQAIYNVEAMHDKLEDIAWVEQQAWIQSLSITGEENYEVEDVEDDIARELAFYNQALAAAVEAVGRFEEAQVPWRRAADFYAEMVKSDEHMARVKGQLMYEQKQIEEAEERRKGREAKRFQKQLNAEKAKERAQAKKAAIAQVQQLRKQRERSGFAAGMDVEAELERMDGRAAASPAASGVRIRSDTGPGKSKKRQFKDTKFGFGGRKRLQKQNDAKSAADMGSYKPARFSDGIAKKVASKRTAKGKPGKQHQRPGKSKRSAMRGKRA